MYEEGEGGRKQGVEGEDRRDWIVGHTVSMRELIMIWKIPTHVRPEERYQSGLEVPLESGLLVLYLP
jgi:hypothetical protein